MTLISLEKVMKQVENRTVLKNIELVIESDSHIGIKMSNEESSALFDLISGNLQPTSGSIRRETSSILSSIQDDGLYDTLTVYSYLTFLNKLPNSLIH